MRAPRVLVACDKFKGSLTSDQVRAAVGAGVRAAVPSADVTGILVSDGGDGLLAVALDAGFTSVPVVVSGPTGEPVETAYAVRPLPGRDRTAIRSEPGRPDRSPADRDHPGPPREVVVELADACGFLRLPDGVRAPVTASSAGLGEVIAAAVAWERPHRIVAGIGGSASTDGGSGLLTALGARLLDARGHDVPPGALGLESVARIDLSGLVLGPRTGTDTRTDADTGTGTSAGTRAGTGTGTTLVIGCDVVAPLTGPGGAAAVFGPQKGATEAQVARLDAALERWADLVARSTGRDLRGVPGAGAAGGVGFAAVALLGATLRPGVDLALDLADLDPALVGVDLVITGEGSLDAQSLLGKAPIGVARRARAHGIPVLAVCGRRALTDPQARAAGIDAIHALTDLEPDPAICMADAGPLLTALTARAVGAWSAGRGVS